MQTNDGYLAVFLLKFMGKYSTDLKAIMHFPVIIRSLNLISHTFYKLSSISEAHTNIS